MEVKADHDSGEHVKNEKDCADVVFPREMHILAHVDVPAVVQANVQKAHDEGESGSKVKVPGKEEADVARELDDK